MNIYETLGLNPVINAAGPLTTLGGSIVNPEVMDAMVAASRNYVDIKQLHQVAGERLAKLIGVEAAHVCASASAGITLMAAATMTGTDPEKAASLPKTEGMKNKFIIHRAHRNAFDHALLIAGGEFVEIDASLDDLKAALTEDVAAIYYTFAWFCEGEVLPIPQVAKLAEAHGIPIIVDAASQVPPLENFTRFIEEGASLVVFSGGKILRGPQSSGFVAGKPEWVAACAVNNSPNIRCIARGMKASKEDIVGLVTAVELYLNRDHDADMVLWKQQVDYLLKHLTPIKDLHAEERMPYGAGYQIPFVAVWWEASKLEKSLRQVVSELKEGTPRIDVRLVNAETSGTQRSEIWLCVHTLQQGEEIILIDHMTRVLTHS